MNCLKKNIIRNILFVSSAIAWIGALSYLGSTFIYQELPINWTVFILLLASIQVFFIPALFLSIPSNKLSPRYALVCIWIIVAMLYWVIAPIYEFLSLYENSRAGIRFLMINYIWEVPIVGGLGVFFIYWHFLKISQEFKSAKNGNQIQKRGVYEKLVYFPIFAGVVILGTSVIAALVGLFAIIIPILHIPWREAIKEIVNISTMGFLAGILFFFVIGHILRPWLEELSQDYD